MASVTHRRNERDPRETRLQAALQLAFAGIDAAAGDGHRTVEMFAEIVRRRLAVAQARTLAGAVDLDAAFTRLLGEG
jgi:hypothetical protein